MAKVRFTVGGCLWVIYNILKKDSLTSGQIQYRINQDFTKWSRAFIQRKLQAGIAMGIFVVEDHVKSKVAGYPAAIYGVKKNGPKIEPCLESVEPEVFYLLKDLERLEASTLTFKAMFKLSADDKLNNTLKYKAVKEKHLYHLKLIAELKSALDTKQAKE